MDPLTRPTGSSGAPVAPLAPGDAASPRPRRPRRRFRLTAARAAILLLIGGYLVLPMFAMLEFSTRGRGGTRSLDPWIAIGNDPKLVESILTSLQIAGLTVVGMLLLLVPTMTWAHLRVPRMRRVIEFLCLLPLAIPAIVIVVGIAPVYRVVYSLFGSSALTLTFVNIVLVLPFAYRAIDGGLRSVDVATLADAARSLGAGWPRLMAQVIVPNIRGGVLSASVLAIALVLGEFTISSLLSFNTLQVVINLLGKRNAFTSVAVSLAALLFAFLLLLVITRFGAARRSRIQSPDEEATAP